MGWLFNRANVDPTEPAIVGNKVFGMGLFEGNKGIVISTRETFTEEWLEVTWTSGPRSGQTESVRQYDVAGTNL